MPAIAIPVDRKDEFACPPSHIAKLKELLPKVNKILVIGWRATETEFLKVLRTKLTGQQDLMIVSWKEADARETLTNLGLSNPLRYPGQNQIVDGFTGLINNLDRLNAFLRS